MGGAEKSHMVIENRVAKTSLTKSTFIKFQGMTEDSRG